jgi:hypothetical protein
VSIIPTVNPFTKYLYAGAAIAIAAALAFTHLTAYRAGRHAVQAKWDEAKVIQERAAQEQTTRNRELQRQAELRYMVRGETRDRFFVTTVKEIRDAAAPLAACPVPESVRVRLNAAARCAADPAASCGPAGQVPGP